MSYCTYDISFIIHVLKITLKPHDITFFLHPYMKKPLQNRAMGSNLKESAYAFDLMEKGDKTEIGRVTSHENVTMIKCNSDNSNIATPCIGTII